MTLLRARELTKTFGETQALRGANMSVESGEVVAIMGASGSGKSTLLHCLAGILVPDSGEIELEGRRVDKMSEAERSILRRRELGFVFQFGQLVPELTAEENVALPLILNGMSRKSALGEARPWFAELGIEGLGERRSGELSGGQAQRVAIARAMVARPTVVFADEPTGSLDSISGENVLRLLTSSARERGTTVIIVTHDARVAAYADREIVVRDGVVVSLNSDAPA